MQSPKNNNGHTYTISSGQQTTLRFIIVGALILWGLNWTFINNTNRGTIGDMFGVFNSFFTGAAFIGVMYGVFYQRKQMQMQQGEIELAEKGAIVTAFENRFYEMLKIHRLNVTEIEIADTVKRRKAFVSMFAEFKFCYLTVYEQAHLRKTNDKVFMPPPSELIDIAYVIFFHGVGPNSDLLTTHLLSSYDDILVKKVVTALSKIKSNIKKIKKESTDLTINYEDPGLEPYTLKVSYLPFGGHGSRLGHYFRHLFQMVSFVMEQDDQLIRNKYSYLKTIRGQMSNHEQLLLYYNGLSYMGRDWVDRGYFTECLMIKNIPLPLANLGIDPISKFGRCNKKGEFLFEWDRHVN